MTESAFTSALAQFSPVSLADMERVSLMNRSDTKFVFSCALLADILPALAAHYHVLDIDGHRLFHYDSMYFDTCERLMYLQHHNGRLNRFKVRTRRYVESGQSYFEVKRKINGRRTVKERIPLEDGPSDIGSGARALIQKATDVDPGALAPVLRVEYARATLVHPVLPERVTIDVSLRFCTEESALVLPQAVIAEVKQERFSRQSVLFQLMQSRRVAPVSISKYCAGMAMSYSDLKHNRFKPKLRALHRVAAIHSNRRN